MQDKIICLVEIGENIPLEHGVPLVKKQITEAIHSLAPYYIFPKGELDIKLSVFLRIAENGELIGGVRAIQGFEGHWLSFLHARRDRLYYHRAKKISKLI